MTMKTQKSGVYAIYQGTEYGAGRDYEQNRMILFSRDRNDLKKGFVQVRPGFFMKFVQVEEIETAYKLYTMAKYKDRLFHIFAEEPGRMLLCHFDVDDETKKLGFIHVERGVMERWVSLADIQGFEEVRTPMWGFE